MLGALMNGTCFDVGAFTRQCRPFFDRRRHTGSLNCEGKESFGLICFFASSSSFIPLGEK